MLNQNYQFTLHKKLSCLIQTNDTFAQNCHCSMRLMWLGSNQILNYKRVGTITTAN